MLCKTIFKNQSATIGWFDGKVQRPQKLKIISSFTLNMRVKLFSFILLYMWVICWILISQWYSSKGRNLPAYFDPIEHAYSPFDGEILKSVGDSIRRELTSWPSMKREVLKSFKEKLSTAKRLVNFFWDQYIHSMKKENPDHLLK